MQLIVNKKGNPSVREGDDLVSPTGPVLQAVACYNVLQGTTMYHSSLQCTTNYYNDYNVLQ